MKTPLEDVTILDLSHALAGPFCSTMLGDFGARVIKVEPPTGDIARAWGVKMTPDDTSYMISLHRNKQGVAIDFKTAEGKALFFEMVKKADPTVQTLSIGACVRACVRAPFCLWCLCWLVEAPPSVSRVLI